MCTMGEKFFYDWTKEQVWSVIESTFRDQTEWQNNEEKVREEFNKLQANQGQCTYVDNTHPQMPL